MFDNKFQDFSQRCNSYLWISLFFVALFGFASQLVAQTLVSDEDAKTARAECLREINVECLLTMALSIPPAAPNRLNRLDNGSGGNLYILRRLGYLDEADALAATLPTTPTSLMAQDDFEAAAELLIEMKKNVIYEHWSAEDEAVLMIAQEHLRRGDIETAIEVTRADHKGWGTPDTYLMRLFEGLLRQNDPERAEQIAYAMSNRPAFDFFTGLGGPRGRALSKLVKFLVDRGRLDKAQELLQDITGLPYHCDAATSVALARFAVGEVAAANDILRLAVEVSAENRSARGANCVIALVGLQIEFGDRDAARDSANLAAEMLNLEPPRGDVRLTPNALVGYFARLATVQKKLTDEVGAEHSLTVARSLFESIDRPHSSFHPDLWLAYATAVVTSGSNDVPDTSALIAMLPLEVYQTLSSSGPTVEFGKALALHGDFEIASQIADHIAQKEQGIFSAYLIKTAILEQMAMRGDIDATRQLAAGLEQSYTQRYQYEQGQRWVARAAFAAGDTSLARQVLQQQLESNPVEPRLAIADLKMFRFADNRLQIYQIQFERALQLPPEQLRLQLIHLASEIGR